jgi:hypothetical protein
MSIDTLIDRLREFAKATCGTVTAANGEQLTYEDSVIWLAADSLASTQAEILRLKAALADAQAMSDAHREHAQSAIENCASLKYSLSHANAALEPFAKAARKAGYYPHSHLLATREVTIHDFRRADTALSLDAAPPSGEATT